MMTGPINSIYQGHFNYETKNRLISRNVRYHSFINLPSYLLVFKESKINIHVKAFCMGVKLCLSN